MLNVCVRTLRATSRAIPFEKKVRGNISTYSKNIWDIIAIDLLHNDFSNIQQVKNELFDSSYMVTEIPPPFCPRCCKHVKTECLFSPLDDISIDDFDLFENPKLTIRCPVFGNISSISDDNLVDDEPIPKKTD